MYSASLQHAARALCGEVCGGQIIAPGPGHSPRDRSLSVKIDPTAPDGFVVHSFAGDPLVECRAYVRAALGLGAGERPHGPPRSPVAAARGCEADERSVLPLRLWNEAHDPRGTIVTTYLTSRCLTLPDDFAGKVIRFHPALTLDGRSVGAMVALFRDINTNEPCAIHRTFLDGTGSKIGRKMLGHARDAAIKIDADENVTLGLHIGEGLETCLAAYLAGFRPVWALGSAGAIARFPVLAGIEAITILGETGDDGASHRAVQTCAARWIEAGREVLVVEPIGCADLNDVWRKVTA
jgi:putative DNA primase/helicase